MPPPPNPQPHARDGIRFVHAWPGFVSTGAWTDAKAAGVPNWVVCLLYPLRLTMITPDSYAEKVVHDVILANVGHPKDSIPRSKTGAQDSTWEWLGQYGEVLKGSKWMIANLDKGARVYEWSRNLVKDLLPVIPPSSLPPPSLSASSPFRRYHVLPLFVVITSCLPLFVVITPPLASPRPTDRTLAPPRARGLFAADPFYALCKIIANSSAGEYNGEAGPGAGWWRRRRRESAEGGGGGGGGAGAGAG